MSRYPHPADMNPRVRHYLAREQASLAMAKAVALNPAAEPEKIAKDVRVWTESAEFWAGLAALEASKPSEVAA